VKCFLTRYKSATNDDFATAGKFSQSRLIKPNQGSRKIAGFSSIVKHILQKKSKTTWTVASGKSLNGPNFSKLRD
jgi:hypothetical protein